jgi:hypothetical protein
MRTHTTDDGTEYHFENIAGTPCAIPHRGRQVRADELVAGMQTWSAMGWWNQPITATRTITSRRDRGQIEWSDQYIHRTAPDFIVTVREQ